MSDVRLSRTARMLDDPQLGGDLLLIGLGLARYVDHGGIPPGKKLGTDLVARDCWPELPAARAGWRIKDRLADDARTYRHPRQTEARDAGCGAPMIRRDGTCGQRSKWSRLLTDWATGERFWLLACSRHVPWYDEVARTNRETTPDVVPLPTANHGGVLAPHFPEFSWPKIWAWATDDRWVEHPEREVRPRPTLTVLLGDADTALPVAVGERTRLGLVSL